jgi:hypothetical protein
VVRKTTLKAILNDMIDKTKQALDLTVHTLPEPTAQRTKNGRLKMLLVLLLCASPVVASYITYYFIRPEGRRNFGELINPQITVPNLTASTLEGKTLNLQTLKGQWLLVSISGAACDKKCENHLYLQRQIRETLGKEKDRLDWVWLVSDDAPISETLKIALKGATVLRLPAEQISTWIQAAQGQKLEDHIYVVDPMGNWMMRYPPGFNAESAVNAKKDLVRLLKASAFWDNAGR